MKSLRHSLKPKEKQKKSLQKTSCSVLPKKIIRALHDYSPHSADPSHLSFIKGDFFHVIGSENDRYYYQVAHPRYSHLSALVPVSYFEVVADSLLNEEKTRERFSNSKLMLPNKRTSAQQHYYHHPHHSSSHHVISPPLPATEIQPPINSHFDNTSTPSLSPASLYPKSPASQPKQSMESVTSRVGAMLYAIVLYDFEAERVDELDAKEGDNIIIVAQSNCEWFVAKPIGRLGGPGLIPVSYIEIRDLVTGAAAADPLEACKRACVPKVEEWKLMTQHYQNSSVSLGQLSSMPAGGGSAVNGADSNNKSEDDDLVFGVAVSSDPQENALDGSYDPAVIDSAGLIDQQPQSSSSSYLYDQESSFQDTRQAPCHGHEQPPQPPQFQDHASDVFVEPSASYSPQSARQSHLSHQSRQSRQSRHSRQEILSTHTPVLAPVSATISRYIFHRDTYWYVIDAKLEDGSCWELQRYYEDFAKLQRNLLKAFPDEAGYVEGVPRSLPFMPGPVKVVTDAISNGRRQNLDEYVKCLLVMPPHISRCQFVRQLFAPRDGDFEIDPVVLEEENSQLEKTFAEESEQQGLDQSPRVFLGSEVFEHEVSYDHNHDNSYEALSQRTRESQSLDQEEHLVEREGEGAREEEDVAETGEERQEERLQSINGYPYIPDLHDLQQHYNETHQRYQEDNAQTQDPYQTPEQPRPYHKPIDLQEHYRNSQDQFYLPHGPYNQQRHSPPNSAYTPRETPVVSPTSRKPTMLNTTPPSLSLPFPSPPASSIYSATPSSSNLPLPSMKLKVHYNDEWLIIRMPEQMTHASLVDRLRERLRIAREKGVVLRTKNEQQKFYELGPLEWADIVHKLDANCGGKIMLWAEERGG